jgi:tetratricopeptide (TPR) repeat protein
MLSMARGAVGVPRDFVAAINGATIGTRQAAVNAARPGRLGLSGCGGSVTLPPSMATKDECFDRAVDHVADGDLDAAIAAYQEALTIDPQFTDAIQGLAMAYADKEMFDEAITWGKKLVELAPEETLAHTSLSMFYQRKGMIPEAEAEGAKARMLDWKRQLAEQKTDDES